MDRRLGLAWMVWDTLHSGEIALQCLSFFMKNFPVLRSFSPFVVIPSISRRGFPSSPTELLNSISFSFVRSWVVGLGIRTYNKKKHHKQQTQKIIKKETAGQKKKRIKILSLEEATI